jgi:hypothetical protein
MTLKWVSYLSRVPKLIWAERASCLPHNPFLIGMLLHPHAQLIPIIPACNRLNLTIGRRFHDILPALNRLSASLFDPPPYLPIPDYGIYRYNNSIRDQPLTKNLIMALNSTNHEATNSISLWAYVRKLPVNDDCGLAL